MYHKSYNHMFKTYERMHKSYNHKHKSYERMHKSYERMHKSYVPQNVTPKKWWTYAHHFYEHMFIIFIWTYAQKRVCKGLIKYRGGGSVNHVLNVHGLYYSRTPSTEYRTPSTEYRIQNTEYRIQNTEHRIQNTKYRTRNTEHEIQNTEYVILDCKTL